MSLNYFILFYNCNFKYLNKCIYRSIDIVFIRLPYDFIEFT